MKIPKDFNNLHNDELIKLLGEGAVGIIPTDTVYGLACQAGNEVAVKRLYALKTREHKPGTIIAADIDQLIDIGIKSRYLKPVQHFWPNSISIVIPSHDLTYIHLGVGSIAVRLPADSKIRAFLKKTGPLLTTSANLPGQPPSSNIQEAKSYFDGRVDFYVDGGDTNSAKPSTIIRIVDDAVEVLREGAVKMDENGKILK